MDSDIKLHKENCLKENKYYITSLESRISELYGDRFESLKKLFCTVLDAKK